MSRFLSLLFIVSFISPHPIWSQSPTFHEDVAPIIYQNCTECHRKGEVGPMPFTTYEEVMNQGAFIKYVTSTGYMPPWSPDPEYSSFKGERYLREDQIQLLSDWYVAGMPEGDPTRNPGLPNFSENGRLGEPDLVITLPEPYVHEGDMTEEYHVFVLETGLEVETEIKAMEICPGNPSIVHHGVLGYTENVESIAIIEARDLKSDDPGFSSWDAAFGTKGFLGEESYESYLHCGYTPGQGIVEYPAGIGQTIGPEGRYLLELHYSPSPIEEEDSTKINFYFAEQPLQRHVQNKIMSAANLDKPFIIPANEVVTFHGTMDITSDMSIMSVAAHMHLLGQSWEVFAVLENWWSPNDTISLISIPAWDFNWQGTFDFTALKHIPAGYTIHAIVTYDNTWRNPSNPHDPPQTVKWGNSTLEEMCLFYISFADYMPGDEDIILPGNDEDAQFIFDEANLFSVGPNAVRKGETVTVGYHLSKADYVELDLLTVSGQQVVNILPKQHVGVGPHAQEFVLPELVAGTYFYRLTTSAGLERSQMIQVLD